MVPEKRGRFRGGRGAVGCRASRARLEGLDDSGAYDALLVLVLGPILAAVMEKRTGTDSSPVPDSAR